MKYFITLCLIASLATVAWTSSATWGKHCPNDTLLYQENVVRRPQNGDFQSEIVKFPKSGKINTKNINAIYVYDRFTKMSGAQPSLWSGGPGYKFATVNLKSQYSKGINSTVEIYGQ